MNPVAAIRRHFATTERSRQMLEEVREGIANQTDVTNRHLARLVDVMAEAVEATKRAEAQRVEARRALERKGFQPPPGRRAGQAEDRAGKRETAVPVRTAPRLRSPGENDLDSREHIFDDIAPYSGTPPSGYLVDWLGVLTDIKFRSYLGLNRDDFDGVWVETARPTLADGEGWFEAVNQVEAARDAHDHFVMVTLGACYGAQAVGSAVALRKLNPMPFKLVAVEPEPVNYEWVAQHFHDNGIDPDEHWLIEAAINDTNRPVFFPVGAPGSGAQNSFSTNHAAARENYVQALIESGRQDEALSNLLLRNTTGLKKSLLPGEGFDAEITLLSAITLDDILAPFPRVDYLEVDIQQSEILVIPPFMDLLKRKVRRIHLGTHGKDVHETLSDLFRDDGWRVVFDYEPNSSHTHRLGSFDLNDGVLTVLNPEIS
ncbi:MAG: FkbM family methyltransferase [Acetobacteraceae bacterium]|jgi:FkbM family methyltransferase